MRHLALGNGLSFVYTHFNHADICGAALWLSVTVVPASEVCPIVNLLNGITTFITTHHKQQQVQLYAAQDSELRRVDLNLYICRKISLIWTNVIGMNWFVLEVAWL